MKKIIIKVDKNNDIDFCSKGIEPEQLLHILSIALVNNSINFGVSKKDLLNAIKGYYEDGMKNIANE